MLRNIPATSVPSITALRRSLGYGDSKDARRQVFYDDVRAFRKKFITSNGIKGKDLHQWKDNAHQAGLREMAVAYLDTHGNGNLFWPTDPNMENFTGLVYADDFIEIKNLVIQLFFRLNLQQYRNEKYRGKGSTDTAKTDGRGMSTDDPIDVDEDAPTRGSRSVPSTPAFVTGRFQFRSSTVESEASRHAASYSQPSFDYTHPDHARDGDYPPPPTDDVDDEPLAKRRRLDNPPGGAGAGSDKRQPKQRESFIITFKSRKSPRDQRTRRVPDQATEEMIQEALASPTRTPMPSESEATYRDKNEPHSRSATTMGDAKQKTPTVPSPEEELQRPDVAAEPSITVHNDVQEAPTPAPAPVKHIAPIAPMMAPWSPPPSLPPQVAPPPPPSRPKPRIIFNYRVILSRSPCFEYVIWTPEGRFTDKTLSDIKKEIPLNLDADAKAKGLLFTLLAPGVKIRIGIPNGKDEQVAVMRREFDRAIRDQIPKASGSEPVFFDIEIEALRDEEQVKTEESRWEGELEW